MDAHFQTSHRNAAFRMIRDSGFWSVHVVALNCYIAVKTNKPKQTLLLQCLVYLYTSVLFNTNLNDALRC